MEYIIRSCWKTPNTANNCFRGSCGQVRGNVGEQASRQPVNGARRSRNLPYTRDSHTQAHASCTGGERVCAHACDDKQPDPVVEGSRGWEELVLPPLPSSPPSSEYQSHARVQVWFPYCCYIAPPLRTCVRVLRFFRD
jgi:hypothetical protein